MRLLFSDIRNDLINTQYLQIVKLQIHTDTKQM